MPLALTPPPGTVGKAWPAILVGFFAAIGGVLFGYDAGTIGGILAMPYWLQEFSTGYQNPETGGPGITSDQESESVSILSAGTFFGALTAAPTGDFFGRRTAATEIPLFVAGRFFAGYGVGMISALIPQYQSETAPKWFRGTIVGAYQLAITIGLLLAAVVPYMVDAGPRNANLQSKVFFIWGSFCFVCIFFVWAMIYEAKGLSLEQVDELYAKVGKAWESIKFVPTVSFQEVQDVGGDHRKSSLADIENVAMRKKSVGHEGIREEKV